jgi:hypothetical protein
VPPSADFSAIEDCSVDAIGEFKQEVVEIAGLDAGRLEVACRFSEVESDPGLNRRREMLATSSKALLQVRVYSERVSVFCCLMLSLPCIS